jgi:hypothetical protein
MQRRQQQKTVQRQSVRLLPCVCMHACYQYCVPAAEECIPNALLVHAVTDARPTCSMACNPDTVCSIAQLIHEQPCGLLARCLLMQA